jgi:Ca2+-binding EF-hand superfamily protein
MSTVDSSNSSAWSQTLSSLSGAMSSYLQDKMLKKMDTDASGGVSQGEFQAALEKVAGKLGVDVGDKASELYAGLDANKDGSLDGSEVGTLLQGLFSSASNTQAFVQSRGDEARFAELDADNDGMISMTEFGITPATETTVIQTTTVVTTVQNSSASLDPTQTAVLPPASPTTPATTSPEVAQTLPATDGAGAAEAVAAADDAATDAAATQGDTTLQALVQDADANADGSISADELNVLVAKINAQAEAASRRYNQTSLAFLGNQGGGLSATA